MTNSSLPLSLDAVGLVEIYQAVTGLSAGHNRASGGLLVRCPSDHHEDVHPSCLIKPCDGVWTCFACSVKGGKLDLVVAAGHARDHSEAAAWLAHNLGRPQSLQEQPKAERWAGDRAEKILVATYSYCDTDGTITEQILRYRTGGGGRGKSFQTRRPDGAGNWIYHRAASCQRPTCACTGTGRLAKTIPPLLPYRLPAILAAGRDGRTGVIVEGEGDADALTALDFAVTTNPYGVDFQYPQSWRRYFDGVKKWIIIPDSDSPGRRAAAERANFIGPSAVILDLFPDDVAEKHGCDVSDWLDLHPGTPEQQRESLLTIFRAALACATR